MVCGINAADDLANLAAIFCPKTERRNARSHIVQLRSCGRATCFGLIRDSSAEAAIPFNAICIDNTRIRQAARGQVGQFLNPEADSGLMAQLSVDPTEQNSLDATPVVRSLATRQSLVAPCLF